MSESFSPRVSVVVPTRNRPDGLADCLRALAAQELRDFEVLIMDDGSNTPALEAARTLAASLGERFSVHSQPTSLAVGTGPGANRNRGVRCASGRWIAFCDDDDRWTDPRFLLDAVGALERSGQRLLFGNQITQKGETVASRDWMPMATKACAGRAPLADTGVFELSRAEILRRPGYAHLNFTVASRDLMLEVGGFWEDVRFAEDVDLFVRLADRCPTILYRPEPAAVHFAAAGPRHESASGDLDFMRQRLLEDAVWHHVIASCRSREALAYAALSAATNQKQVVQKLAERGNRRAAGLLARKALALRPTLKWAAFTAWMALRRG